ncbi:helix-hairpin-helix domain-containing protein [Amycolatopsis nigrescens]|uniref:helix-hairpin-helix domain-containing protein n=1 Tax=Amycolatopsis nigrescens TaxID=381445 RepID=UPI000382CE29|nr:helix-hairpin-helix domain-containing protein [Amycolatopsis nigrescens]
MKVRTRHSGRRSPFERDRRLVLRRLPAGAVVTRAAITVSPHSLDPERRFTETITFAGPAGDWGANKRAVPGTPAAVEIELHARRQLAAVTGTGLTTGKLLVDLGGGFTPVGATGAIGGTPEFELPASGELPGLTVTGLRISQTGSDVTTLRVASPPSNVTLAVAGGPVFFTHFGALVEPVTTPDFAGLLQAMLPELEVLHGHHVVPFVLHSDSIARLDLVLDLEFEVETGAMPDGLGTMRVPYTFDGAPEGGRASLAVPPGMVAAPGGTTGRIQGAFEASKVVHGPVAAGAPAELVPLGPESPLAQPFVLDRTELATSVDLLLTAVTAEVALTVDLVEDADGKPGRRSLLPAPAARALTRDQAPGPTWVNIALPGEVEFTEGVRRWVVLQAKTGRAAWGTDGTDGVSLQQTGDGGLSWRQAGAGPSAARLRLRHTARDFRMPLELRVAAEESEVAVSLQRFAPQGAIDLGLDFPEVAAAVNEALTTAGHGADGGGEHVANGGFTDWYRIGAEPDSNESGALRPSSAQPVFGPAVFGPAGRTAYLALRDGAGARLAAFDPLCRDELLNSEIGSGVPTAMTLDAAGGRALVALAQPTDLGPLAVTVPGWRLVLVDTATGRLIGSPVRAQVPDEEPVPPAVHALVCSADGLAVFALCQEDDTSSRLYRIPWTLLADAAIAGTELPLAELESTELGGRPKALTVGQDGKLYVLTESVELSTLHVLAGIADFGRSVTVLNGAADVAVTGSTVLVAGPAVLRFLRAGDLRTVVDLPLEVSARRVGVDPAGELALVAHDGGLLSVDLRRRVTRPVFVGLSSGDGLAMSPSGTHAVVTGDQFAAAKMVVLGRLQPVDWQLTAGEVRPRCLANGSGTLAVLGVPGGCIGYLATLSALSQVVPVVAGTRYRFAFDGVTDSEGATGEVIWRGVGCAPLGTERLPVTVLDLDNERTLDRLPRHETALVSPAGATQAEIRFSTQEGVLGVDSVSLAGSANVASPSWQPSEPSVLVTPADTGLTLANGGGAPAAVRQFAAAEGGQRFGLEVTAVASPGCAVELAFSDELSAPVGEVVRLELDQLEFDVRAVSGEVPVGTTEAELRIVLPPGGSVELTALELTIGAANEVGLYFVSEAPGELAMTGVAVRLDLAAPSVPPVPPDGLCPPRAPAGDGEQCFCGPCGQDRPVGRSTPARTASGRPASVTACPACGSPRIRLGGRPVAGADPVALPLYRLPARSGPPRRGPAVRAKLRVPAKLTAISGVAANRAAELRAAGIPTVVALAKAEVATVAALPGFSPRMAKTFIAEANRLVQDRGEHVLFDR